MHVKFMKNIAAALLSGGMILLAGCGAEEQTFLSGIQTEEIRTVSGEEPQSGAAEFPSAENLQPGGGQTAPVEEPQSADAQTASGQGSGNSLICVFVCGAVCSPGVYELSEGARVYEALEAAGGFSDLADTEFLNQAEPLSDGQKLYVYSKEEAAELISAQKNPEAEALSGSDSPAGPSLQDTGSRNGICADGRIDLNTADRETLMTLPGIGEAKADAILEYWNANGRFRSIEEIQNISGIKSAVFSKIKDKITVT